MTLFQEPIPGLRWLSLRTPTLPPATHTNCFIVGAGALTVVDPGSPYPDEQQRLQEALDHLRAQGHEVARVLLTHHHHDHTGGLEPFRRRGVPVWAHAQDAHHVQVRVAHYPSDAEHLPGSDFSVLHTPGHTPGHVVVWHGPSRSLICGDLMASASTILINPPEGDMHHYFGSLERVRGLSPQMIYPSHGHPLPGQHIETYIQHRQRREALILEAVRNHHHTLPSIVRVAYADTPPAAWPLATRSALAHLLRLRALDLVHGDERKGFFPA